MCSFFSETVNLGVDRRHGTLNEKQWARLFALFVKTKKAKSNYIQPCHIRIEAINRASIEWGEKLNKVVGDYVHLNCRKKYIHVWYISDVATKKNQSEVDKQKTPKFTTII